MRRTNIYLSEEQLELLRGVAGQRGTSVAALVREVLAEWLDEHGVRPVEAGEWAARLDALLARRTLVAAAGGFTEPEVELDVSEAIREARAARRR